MSFIDQLQKVDTTIFGLPPHEAADSSYIASMGVYAFRLDILLKLLRQAMHFCCLLVSAFGRSS